jgi:DEAD/DEAH box helicase domain-containing protein
MIIFDLETQFLAAEVGGWGNKELLRLAVACTWDEQRQYQVWQEPQAPDLIAELQGHDIIVGFNTRVFDFAVLSFYGDTRGFEDKNFDVLAEVRQQTGKTLSLNHLASINLGEAKSYESGTVAVELWRQGRIEELIAYCQKDVELTKRLFEKWEAEGIIWVDGNFTRYAVWPGYFHLLDGQKEKRRKRKRN